VLQNAPTRVEQHSFQNQNVECRAERWVSATSLKMRVRSPRMVYAVSESTMLFVYVCQNIDGYIPG